MQSVVGEMFRPRSARDCVWEKDWFQGWDSAQRILAMTSSASPTLHPAPWRSARSTSLRRDGHPAISCRQRGQVIACILSRINRTGLILDST